MYEDLAIFGLDKHDADVYVNLINTGKMTVNEIGKICKISKAKVYSVLSKLLDLDLIGYEGGRPKRYFAHNPALKLQCRKNKMIEEIEIKGDYWIESLSKKFKERVDSAFSQRIQGIFIKDRKLALQKFAELIDQAYKEIHFIEIPLDILHFFKERIDRAKNRGVDIKIIASEDDILPTQLKMFNGFQIRFIKFPKNKFLIDNNEFLVGRFFIDNEKFGTLMYSGGNELALNCLNAPGCASCVKRGNAQLWEISKNVPPILLEETGDVSLIRSALKQNKKLSKREISNITSLSGSQVKNAIEYLLSKGEIEVTLERTKGRPREAISLLR
ncbi:MAG: helix-turn-helix domain-containing protein [Candidatus Thermoplasmatota archaeon]